MERHFKFPITRLKFKNGKETRKTLKKQLDSVQVAIEFAPPLHQHKLPLQTKNPEFNFMFFFLDLVNFPRLSMASVKAVDQYRD